MKRSPSGWADVDPDTGRPAILDDPVAIAKFVRLLHSIRDREQLEAVQMVHSRITVDRAAVQAGVRRKAS